MSSMSSRYLKGRAKASLRTNKDLQPYTQTDELNGKFFTNTMKADTKQKVMLNGPDFRKNHKSSGMVL